MAGQKGVAAEDYCGWYWAVNDMSTSRPMCFPFWKKYEDIDQEAGRAGSENRYDKVLSAAAEETCEQWKRPGGKY